MLQALKGNILELPRLGDYRITEGGYLLLEDGVIQGVYPVLPERYATCEVIDYSDQIITQSFTDLHLHAPQYPMLGLGLDLPLLDWLKTYTFRTEACFSDLDFARESYQALAKDLVDRGTTRVVMFSSLHTDASLILMQALADAGLSGYVGKVNMDRNGGENYEEATEDSMRETLRFLSEYESRRNQLPNVKPILTPRFTPTCTDALMAFLGDLARTQGLPIQSHLSENEAEISWVRELHPDCEEYWESYAKFGLLNERTVMAHCVHSSPREIAALKQHGVYVAHCPDSNINLTSGLMPLRTMLDCGVNVALGSDIGAGAELSMNRVVTAAVRVANAYSMTIGHEERLITLAEAAYLATSAGAAYFGAKPGFAVGDRLHALVLNDASLPRPTRRLAVKERYERLLYLMDGSCITARYAEGRQIG